MRARREFANQSAVGFITTATNRNLDDATRFLPGQAYTGGVDWDWRMAKRYAIQGFWAASSVRGDQAAIAELQESTVHSFQRPDADYLDAGSDPDLAQRLQRAARPEQDRRPARALQQQRLGEESGLRQQRHRLHAPRRSADR